MAKSPAVKFDKMYQYLSEHNFEMNESVPSDFKCGKCKQILINAYIGSCLCQFCLNCVDEMLMNGVEQCPGNKNECKEELLTNFVSDHMTNSKISNLKLKCPEQMCLHECEIVKMDEHLRLCSNRSVTCPFFGMGCNKVKLVADQIGDHLQAESYNHNRMLIEMIETLRNELKKSDEINKLEIKTLKDNARMKDKTIAEMQEKIQKNKTQIEDLLTENALIKHDMIVDRQEGIQRNKTLIDEILTENARMKDGTNVEIKAQIKLIKTANHEIAAQINDLKMESQNQIDNSTKQIKEEWRDSLFGQVTPINDGIEKLRLQLTSRIDEVETWRDRQMEGLFAWRIDKISDKMQNYTKIFSAIFYSKINSYKMQLRMGNYKGIDEMYVNLYIHSGEMDAGITWPYQANITIKISNNAQPNASQIITKHCKFTRPDNNSHKFSESFYFSYTELLTAGLMQDNYFVIQCCEE